MFHVSLGVLCHHRLFQRKKRSVSIKRKRSRKSLSKVKAKPLNFLALKKSPAKRFAPKKKRPIPGYQATAPARPRGDFRVTLKKKTKSHQDLPILKGKSLMEDPELPVLTCVEAAESLASLKGSVANNHFFELLN